MALYKERLLRKIQKKQSNLCLGIDLHTQELPLFFETYINENGALEFAKKWSQILIDLASYHLPAVKFQSSFFEALGGGGYDLLSSLVKDASSKGLITILDVKRCDISSTMDAYGYSAFERIKADAMTVISYMGADVLRPLHKWMKKGHGVYSVFLSSNPSGLSRQSSPLKEKSYTADYFHSEIFEELEAKNLENAFGLVIGAPSYELYKKSLSSYLHKFSFLLPGLGFQGGEITESLRSLIKKESSHLFPMSRSLSALGHPLLNKEISSIKTFSEYEDFVEKQVFIYKAKI